MVRRIPEGYEQITNGKVRSSDLCYGDDKQWMHPTRTDWEMLGSDVESFYFVIRKLVVMEDK